MRKSVILITGANGEMGHGLIRSFNNYNSNRIVGLDLELLDESIRPLVYESVSGNILDTNVLERINSEYEITEIYHLAALLSTRAEFSPISAHDVNVGGTLQLLNLAVEQSRSHGKPVKFFFPSSIAVYGLGGLEEKNKSVKVDESEYTFPETMYGCNKLYCEHLGRYYSHYYNRLAAEYSPGLVDFRAIRFPGLISAITLPTGGTTDYAPEMLHSAARNKPYKCFVRNDTRLPFMIMPDAIDAIRDIMGVQKKKLTKTVYNIRAFSVSADDFRTTILEQYPNAEIGFKIDEKRQSMVDSWPQDVIDTAARKDWNFSPKFNFIDAFNNYLIPEIRKQYV